MSNQQVSRTVFTIVSTDDQFEIPGDRSADFIVANYANDIPGIGNLQASETVTTVDGATVRSITFKPRVGTKG